MPTSFIGPVSAKSGQLREDWQHSDGKAHTRLADSWDDLEGVTKVALLSWDTGSLSWVKFTAAAGGGGGGPATIADGADVAQGAKADTAWDGVAASASVVAILKKLATAGGGATSISDGADVTQGAKADSAWDGAAASPTAQAILKYLGAKIEAVRALLAGTLAVSGPLTDAQLRASAPNVGVADGGNVTQGAKADAAWDGVAASPTMVAILKALWTKLAGSLVITQATPANLQATVTQGPAGAAAWKTDGSAVTQPVSMAANTPDVTDRVGRLLGHVTVDSSVLPTGAAKETGGNLDALVIGQASQATATKQDLALTALTLLDTDLKGELGVLSGTPGAYTVLDRLNQIGLKLDAAAKINATDATLRQVVAALKPVPGVSAVRATLLHR